MPLFKQLIISALLSMTFGSVAWAHGFHGGGGYHGGGGGYHGGGGGYHGNSGYYHGYNGYHVYSGGAVFIYPYGVYSYPYPTYPYPINPYSYDTTVDNDVTSSNVPGHLEFQNGSWVFVPINNRMLSIDWLS